MGKDMKQLLAFATKHPGWHSWAKNRATYDAVRRLCKQGYLIVNKFQQFKLDV